jgi:putative transposase
VKYRFIERCRDAFPIRMMCRLLKVSPSGFYDWRTRPRSARAQANERLLQRIRILHSASDGVLGRRRIREDLVEAGERCSPNRVGRLMHKANLKGVPQRKQWRKKPSGTRPDSVDNHLARDFEAQGPNRKWVTDITYVRTAENWLYLCVVIDLFSRQVVGWSMSAIQDRQLVLQAVLMALWQRADRYPVILHSDRGCQFTSDEYQRFLKGHHLVCSMSGVGSCADNAVAEGFFGMLKRERVNRRRYCTRAEARADIFDYIECFYNPRMRRRLQNIEQQEFALNSTVRGIGA